MRPGIRAHFSSPTALLARSQMAKKKFGKAPFPVRSLDSDEPFRARELRLITAERPNGVSLCLRSSHGHPKRGGYFFHFRPAKRGSGYDVFEFGRNFVASMDEEFLLRFINHIAGRQFDSDQQAYCVNVVNQRRDETEPDRDSSA